MQILAFLLARLKEPSTYAGLGLVLTAIGLPLTGAQTDAIIQVLMGFAGLAAALLQEGQK
jgi:uncharacterized membrane protein